MIVRHYCSPSLGVDHLSQLNMKSAKTYMGLRAMAKSRMSLMRLGTGTGVMLFGLVVSLSTAAFGQELSFVGRDGTKVPLTKSTTELAVVFDSAEVAETASARLETAGVGNVEALDFAPRARVRLVTALPGQGQGDVITEDTRTKILADQDVESVQSVYRTSPSGKPIVGTGEFIVRVRVGLTSSEVAKLWSDYAVAPVRSFSRLKNTYVLRPAAGANEIIVAERMAGDSRTEWSHPNLRVAAAPAQVIPSDQYFSLQWHLHSTGQTGGKDDADIDAIEAWQISSGSGVLFGMFDDSCDVDHEDLSDNYIGIGQDPTVPFFDPERNNPRPKFFDDAHGTAVMGLAVAAANSSGVRGVAYQARFTASRGLLDFFTFDQVAAAFEFALEQGVDVHINSWGPREAVLRIPPVVEDAITMAIEQGRDPDGDGPEEPRGMVVLFAAGNENRQMVPGFDLALIPGVIAVGASTQDDVRADFSNFGDGLDVMAAGGVDFEFGVTTTDTTDGEIAFGYNLGGFSLFVGQTDIDPNGLYTGFFGGTSAACPIAAGVAGLVLSVNSDLTAGEVKTLMHHSCDQINPSDAQYDGITGKSFKYGYGRINADRAVRAARDSLEIGVWPNDPGDLHIDGSKLVWDAGINTKEFLVVESNNVYSFAPQDGLCYSDDQNNCGSSTLADLPTGVRVAFVGCPNGECADGTEQSAEFVRPRFGTKLLAVYARSASGLYSFGQPATVQAVQPPAVTITASRLSGESPLTVRFNGNAVSEVEIDPARSQWDFDVANLLGDNINVNATSASTFFTYTAPAGITRAYTARLTMYDVLGTPGFREVSIQVQGPALPDNIGTIDEFGMRIVSAIPGTPGSNVELGRSPFSVELRLEADNPATIQSVVWNLGDGSAAVAGLSVLHTYVNPDLTNRNIVVTATVTSLTSGGTPITRVVSKLITVTPGSSQSNTEEPKLPGTELYGSGGSAGPCGAIGIIPLLGTLLALRFMRRRSW